MRACEFIGVPPLQYWLRSKLLLVDGGLGGGLLLGRGAAAIVVLLGFAIPLKAVGGRLALRLVPQDPRYNDSGVCHYLQ